MDDWCQLWRHRRLVVVDVSIVLSPRQCTCPSRVTLETDVYWRLVCTLIQKLSSRLFKVGIVVRKAKYRCERYTRLITYLGSSLGNGQLEDYLPRHPSKFQSPSRGADLNRGPLLQCDRTRNQYDFPQNPEVEAQYLMLGNVVGQEVPISW